MNIILFAGQIAVSAPFALKESLKAIPGASWNKSLRRWCYPPSPHVALALAQLCENLKRAGITITIVPEVLAIMKQAQAVDEAQQFKAAAELPNIPGSRTPAWHHQKQAFWFALKLLSK